MSGYNPHLFEPVLLRTGERVAGYSNVPFTNLEDHFKNRKGIASTPDRRERIKKRRDREIRQGTAEVLELQIQSEETDE